MPIAPLVPPPAPRPAGAVAGKEAPSRPAWADYFEPQAASEASPGNASGQTFPRNFGVEIEMVRSPQVTKRTVSRVLRSVLPPAPAPAEADAIDPACDSDNEDHDVYDALDRRWEVKNDEPNIEIATPILRTHEDLSMLQRVVAALEKSGATCDNGTGVHVHVDADRIDAPALTYLLALVTRHEPYIFSALEVEHTRRNIYCRPLALAQVKHAVRAAPQSIDDLAAAFRVNPFMAKFVGVNFEPIFARGGFGTIEFRYFNGCLDPHAIGCYVGYVMALMHHTATEAASPAPDAHATLPGLLQTVGLAPNSPVSRLLCDRLRANLESLTRATPHLAELVRSQYYTGDAALLLSMGVPAESIERVLEKDLHPEAFLTHAVSFMRYIPMGTNAGAFKHFCAVPAEHRAELVTLAKSLLDTPRFASDAGKVFMQLCRVPQSRRAKWIRCAERAPVRVLVHFSHADTPPLAYAFSQMGLRDSEFPGTVALGHKILNVLRDGPGAVKAKVQAVADTDWMHLDDTNLRGRLMLSLLDLAPEDITRLGELTRPILAKVVAPDSYASLLEAFCDADPKHWVTYANRLDALLSGPEAHVTLFALRNGFGTQATFSKTTSATPTVIRLESLYTPKRCMFEPRQHHLCNGLASIHIGIARKDKRAEAHIDVPLNLGHHLGGASHQCRPTTGASTPNARPQLGLNVTLCVRHLAHLSLAQHPRGLRILRAIDNRLPGLVAWKPRHDHLGCCMGLFRRLAHDNMQAQSEVQAPAIVLLGHLAHVLHLRMQAIFSLRKEQVHIGAFGCQAFAHIACTRQIQRGRRLLEATRWRAREVALVVFAVMRDARLRPGLRQYIECLVATRPALRRGHALSVQIGADDIDGQTSV